MAAGTFAMSGLVKTTARAAGAPTLPRTPSGELGPFYPVDPPRGTDADLTRLRKLGTRALGDLVEISGRVVFRDGTPQPHARLEIWQANAAGRYAHPGDTRVDAPLDPNFQGYADLKADAQGRFRFLTVRPGLYPADSTFQRSPHIHFDIRGRARRLITQMYFSDTDAKVTAQDKVIAHDLWGASAPLPSTIFANRQTERSTWDAKAALYQFDIVL
ncbi:MAG TPA: protocatechuate 3,4-dioxygenase [Kofleriaceae bacterium]|jgi:protocatechuate 3,4-dioxygenase beta subunit